MTPLLLALLAAAPEVNLLSLEAGGVVVAAPTSWGGVWSPEALVDGSLSTGWCSAAEVKGPHAFVFELEQRSALVSVDASNANAEESSNPGISTSGLEVWVSSAGPAEGFTRVATMSLKRSGQASAKLPKETLGRWVRLVITGNHGHARYTELTEVVVMGHPLEGSPQRNLSGAWRLESGGVLKLAADGAALTGCATWPEQLWSVKGAVSGRSGALSWSDFEGATGTAVVVLSDDGALRGRWRTDTGNSGSWAASRVEPVVRPKGEALPASLELSCRDAADELRFMRRVRAERFGVTLTGVSFDANDELRLDARNELGPLTRMLEATGSRARLLVLGRSTEPPADELKRCERRAQRLLQRLQQGGVPTSAVDVGIGILKSGAAVQLEPRVEAVLLEGK